MWFTQETVRKTISDLIPGVPEVDPLEIQRIQEAEQIAEYKKEITDAILKEMNQKVKECALTGVNPNPLFEEIRSKLEAMISNNLSEKIEAVDEMMRKFVVLYEQTRRDSIVAAHVSKIVDLMTDDSNLDFEPGSLPRF